MSLRQTGENGPLGRVDSINLALKCFAVNRLNAGLYCIVNGVAGF